MNMEFRDLLNWDDLLVLENGVDRDLQAGDICVRGPTTPWVAPCSNDLSFRLSGNIFSTREAIARSLKVEVESLGEALLKGMEERVKPEEARVPNFYREIDIEEVPLPRYFKGDGGSYITSGIVHTGIDGERNLSFHRMMYIGGGRFAVRVVPRHLKHMLDTALSRGEELKAVVSMGCDAASLIAASCSLPYGVDEMEVASSLHMGATGERMKCFSPDGDGLLSPMGAEIVICGTFTAETAPEGPFVDITSTYDRSGMEPGEPIFRVDRVLAREDPIVHILLPGGREHYLLMGLPKEPSILQSVRKVVPHVKGVRLTEGGCGWLHCVVSIRKQKEGDGKNAIMAAFTGHPSMKRVVIVDEDVDIFDDNMVEWALATRFQPHRDLLIVENVRGSTLDPSANEDGTTSKMGMDATVPLGNREPFRRVQ